MRISTSQMFDRPTALMTALGARADTLQTQIATGKRVTAPSQDPGSWLRIDGLRRAGADDAANAANVSLAQGLLAQGDTTLASIETQLQRAQELAIQAGSTTLNDTNRASIAVAIDSIRGDLFALANTRDVRGQPLFGGATGDTAYVRAEDGTIEYAGEGDPAPIPIGDGNMVHPTIGGDRAFGDMFAVLEALSAALAGGEGPGDASDRLAGALDQVSAGRASIGARALRMDLEAERLTDATTARGESLATLEQTDVPAAIAELQKTLTVLQATQASFTKLSGLTLFDYLR